MFEKIPDIMTFKECQKLLKVGKNTLLNLIHNGEIAFLPSVLYGNAPMLR